MAKISAREAVLYWILIIIIILGGAATFGYFFLNDQTAQETGTSLVTLPGVSQNPNEPATGTVAPVSLTDSIIQLNNPSSPSSGGGVVTQPSAGSGGVVSAPGDGGDRVNTSIEQGNGGPPINTLISSAPERQNQLLEAGSNVQTNEAFLASGSVLPESAPEAGISALVLSGVASLSIAGVASTMLLRRSKKQSTKLR